jgi:hypothetical protein
MAWPTKGSGKTKSVFGSSRGDGTGTGAGLNSDILQPGLNAGSQQPSGKGRVNAVPPSNLAKKHGKKLGMSVFGRARVSPGFPAGLGPKSAHDGY